MGITTAYMVPHPPFIIPEIGRGEEKKIQATIDAYEEIARRVGQDRPDTIVLISPHQTMYADYFHISPGEAASGDFRQFGAGQVRLEADYDKDFTELLCQFAVGRNAGRAGKAAGSWNDGTAVFYKQALDELSAGARRAVRTVFCGTLPARPVYPEDCRGIGPQDGSDWQRGSVPQTPGRRTLRIPGRRSKVR